jgi:DNA-binding MarR family transcriptional regulator/GNAT superfamily N-acetyltransferase
MDKNHPPADVQAMRAFNRFYTRFVGALDEGHLDSAFSLAEVRVLYELAHADAERGLTARSIAAALGLDAGYLSRMLKVFRDRGLIEAQPGEKDRRETLLSLSEEGRAVFAPLYDAANTEVGSVLDGLSPSNRQRLLSAMATIQNVLSDKDDERREPFVLRPHRIGDMGWVVQREAVLYAREYGWDGSFEALIAEIVAKFLRDFDPKREICFIAEMGAEPVGAIFLIDGGTNDAGERIAKIRLLHVEASARGLGIGKRLVDEAIHFARDHGYARVTLWTNDILAAARRIYQAAGFELVEEEAHHSFGKDLVGQNWELKLQNEP